MATKQSQSKGPKYFTNKLEHCGCGSRLFPHCEVEATLYELNGFKTVAVMTKRCSDKGCRIVFGVNFKWQNGQKVNTATASDLESGILFVSNKRAFDVKYLQ